MLLQPLVENAFIHGLESRPSDGTLYLGAKVEGNMLSITVRDNGAGITPGKARGAGSALFRKRVRHVRSISAWSIFPHGCACNTATPPDCTSPARQATAHA